MSPWHSSVLFPENMDANDREVICIDSDGSDSASDVDLMSPSFNSACTGQDDIRYLNVRINYSIQIPIKNV